MSCFTSSPDYPPPYPPPQEGRGNIEAESPPGGEPRGISIVLEFKDLFTFPRTKSLALLRAFFREASKASASSIFLEGDSSGRYSLIGLHPRQSIRLLKNGLQLCWMTQDDRREERFIPHAELSSETLWDILRSATDTLQSFQKPDAAPDFPFSGGWLGYFGYEFSRWCEPALWLAVSDRQNRALPECLLYEFQDVLLIDWQAEKVWCLTSSDTAETDGGENIYSNLWRVGLSGYTPAVSYGEIRTVTLPEIDLYAQTFDRSLSEEEFIQAVERIRGHIERGELYQANLSLQFQKTMRLSIHELYHSFSERNPSPFSALFLFPEGAILCNSPERLVQVDGKGCVQTRPIAGTRGRGQSMAEEESIGHTLLANPKEQAEHLMLVDLERNDLGRICAAGTVTVDELMVLERYSHVTHIVSNIFGRLQTGKDIWEVLRAVFPGGTITGCPKIRCMKFLSEIETVPRGPYTGSLGYIDPFQNTADLNILIRSLYLQATGTPLMYNTAIHAGAGIVADSVGEYEYRECLRKAAAILGVLQDYEQPG